MCRTFLKCAVILALLLGVACTIPPSNAPLPPASDAADRSALPRTELESMEELTAFEAVRRARPTWLRYRGRSVLTGPEREGLRVYLDGAFYGDAESLGQLQVRNIEEIRFLESPRATLRFGTGHTVGAILVVTRR